MGRNEKSGGTLEEMCLGVNLNKCVFIGVSCCGYVRVKFAFNRRHSA